MYRILRSLRSALALAAVLAAAAMLVPGSALAGCGCDHPVPEEQLVMPPFASIGDVVRLHPDGFSFRDGRAYEVAIGGRVLSAVAADGVLDVAVPPGAIIGPDAIHVSGPGVKHRYGDHLFTILPLARSIAPGSNILIVQDLDAAVTSDGILMVPFDLAGVLDPTQFAMRIEDMSLTFTSDEVVFYNADGFDLTLFTIETADATSKEWGSYYGWDVNQDDGLGGTVYDTKVKGSATGASDMVTYWRHEFFTYEAAHRPGGTHEVDETGMWHVNLASRHVNHERLILAVDARLRDRHSPEDLSLATPLKPGRLRVTLAVSSVVSDVPVEPEEMEALLDGATVTVMEKSFQVEAEMVPEEEENLATSEESLDFESDADSVQRTTSTEEPLLADSTTTTSTSSSDTGKKGKGRR